MTRNLCLLQSWFLYIFFFFNAVKLEESRPNSTVICLFLKWSLAESWVDMLILVWYLKSLIINLCPKHNYLLILRKSFIGSRALVLSSNVDKHLFNNLVHNRVDIYLLITKWQLPLFLKNHDFKKKFFLNFSFSFSWYWRLCRLENCVGILNSNPKFSSYLC